MVWTKFGLNGARMVKFGFGGEIFVFLKVEKWRFCVADKGLKSRYAYN